MRGMLQAAEQQPHRHPAAHIGQRDSAALDSDVIATIVVQKTDALAGCDRGQAAISRSPWAMLTRRAVDSHPACGPQ
jgi:hypothetical protein